MNDDDVLEDSLAVAHNLCETIESYAQSGKPESVVFALHELISLDGEFPAATWDSLVMLSRSRNPVVRRAVARHGLPVIFTKVERAGALTMLKWLLDDSDAEVRRSAARSGCSILLDMNLSELPLLEPPGGVR